MSGKFILGSGFFGGHKEREFAEIWGECLRKHLSQKPESIIVLSVGDSDISRPAWRRFLPEWGMFPQWIRLNGNLGHIGQVMSGEKPYLMCGWSGALLWLAMTAYNNESDLCFVEQDTLAFGDWFGQMMEDLGDGEMIFGHKHEGPPWMHCEQSILYIRHSFIPTFIADYISLGPESNEDLIPETKFRRIEMLHPNKVSRLSFGPGRVRPINFDSLPLYAQKFSDEELSEVYRRGLL